LIDDDNKSAATFYEKSDFSFNKLPRFNKLDNNKNNLNNIYNNSISNDNFDVCQKIDFGNKK
jgi:hypothetical protein